MADGKPGVTLRQKLSVEPVQVITTVMVIADKLLR